MAASWIDSQGWYIFKPRFRAHGPDLVNPLGGEKYSIRKEFDVCIFPDGKMLMSKTDVMEWTEL